MIVYADAVMGLNFAVDFLLLFGAGKLSGGTVRISRLLLAATFGGIYAGICLIPGMIFLGGPLWRIVSLVMISVLAFGMRPDTLRCGIVFGLLSCCLGGLALCLAQPTMPGLIWMASAVAVACMLWVRLGIGKQSYASVRVRYDGRENRFTALKDTGNTLCDPITGEGVLVVGADVAGELLGISEWELMDPVGTVATGKYRGMRLIPYRTVAQSGMMLGVCMDEVWIDGQRAGRLVAFSPGILDRKAGYQALTGG